MATNIGPAMAYRPPSNYDPHNPVMVSHQGDGKRAHITGQHHRSTLREMKADILACHPDATKIKKVGHSLATYCTPLAIVGRYHATDIIMYLPETRELLLRCHQHFGGPEELGWHTPSTRNAFEKLMPNILGDGWRCRAYGAGKNATGLSLFRSSQWSWGDEVAKTTMTGRESTTIHIGE